MEKRWVENNHSDKTAIDRLAGELNVNAVVASLLTKRGIYTFDQAKDFFRPSILHLHDPFLMKDMDIAYSRIKISLQNQEKMMVYGDYDVDGTTAVALVYRFFSKYYDQLEYYIPDRYLEGYGISYKGINYAAENNFSLIIALDCGIKSVDHVAYAKAKGVDFIICDHHLPGRNLPDAVAVLDPKRADCSYPYKELAGCGIGFKLIQAYTQKNDLPFEDLEAYLDLVAVSIAADIVPIDGENRTLAWFGMKRLNEQPCAGLAALRSIAKQKPYYTLSDAVFQLGPRINAAGRIADAKQAVRLLSCNNQPEALEIAKLIDVHNDERRGHDSDITEQALTQLESGVDFKTRKSTVVFNEGWHKGVIGIVASRLTEKYYRPTVVLTQSNGVVAGSARSVMGFDLYEALLACTDLLEQFGGHKYAAGLTMKVENVPAFQQRFEEVVTASISDELLVQEISIDSPLNLAQIDAKFFRILSQFEPFGPKNMSPIFIASGVELAGAIGIVGETHLKMQVKQGDSNVFDCIGFGLGKLKEALLGSKSFDMCFSIEENSWKDRRNIQLNIKDIRILEGNNVI